MSKQHPSIDQNSLVQMPELPEWLIFESKTVHCVKGGRILAHQDTSSCVYIVKRGTVIVYSLSSNGQENKIVFVKEGGVIGEMEAIAGCKNIIYYAKALTACDLIHIPLHAFIKWVQSDVNVTWQLARVLAVKLCNAAMQSSQYVECDATNRLVAFLSQHGAGRVIYTRQELAEVCSVSLRTINRCVKRLNDNGIISLDRGKIIISISQLREIENIADD